MSQPSYPRAQTPAEFAAAVAHVRSRMVAAAERVGRDPAGVTLLPVSKTVTQERMRAAIESGLTVFGENKVQEVVRKSAELADIEGLRWEVIGHLQTNKARDVAALAGRFQALDSLRLAEALDRRLQAAGRAIDVFVQVNTSGEESKFGLAPEEVSDFIRALPTFSSLRPRGLMTLAVFSSDTDRVRACFARLRQIRDQVRELDVAGAADIAELSMGMSGDYETAIEEGATVVRVGQGIFGARSTPDSAYWPGAPA